MPEGWFRYVAPAREHAYAALGWRTIGATLSPHDARPAVLMEWPHPDLLPIEPPDPEHRLAQITYRDFCAGVVFEGDTVVRAAPILRYMAAQAWTRQQVFDYCSRRGWSITTLP